MDVVVERHDNEFRLVHVAEELVPAVRKAAFAAGDGYWFKRFPPGTPHLDRAWTNFARLILPMLRQTAGLDPVPWADALATVCHRLIPAGVDWWLTGSAALAVRGIPVTPGDLDLVVTDTDAHRVGDLLLDGLIEPVAPADWFCSWWGRAMLTARVEWVGGVGPSGMGAYHGKFGFEQFSHKKTVMTKPTRPDVGAFIYPPYTEKAFKLARRLF